MSVAAELPRIVYEAGASGEIEHQRAGLREVHEADDVWRRVISGQ
jgi:hypothetical protein